MSAAASITITPVADGGHREGRRPIIVGGDVTVWFGELDEPRTEGHVRVRVFNPALVWLAHEHEPWRPNAF